MDLTPRHEDVQPSGQLGRHAPPSQAMKDAAAFFKPRNVHSVLDVGCGIGRWAMFLAAEGFHVSGYDPDDPAIAEAEAWAVDDVVEEVDFAAAPLLTPPFGGKRFDAFVADLVLDRLSRREMRLAIDTLAARVRRGGLAFAAFHPFTAAAEGEAPPHTVYKDNELRGSFPEFQVMEFRSYPGGYRGLFLKKIELGFGLERGSL